MRLILPVLALALGGQDVAEWPVPLQAYNNATMWGMPYKPECFHDQQADWLRQIYRRLFAAREKLVARYGRETVDNARGIVIEGAVKRWAPCDDRKQREFLTGYEASVAALEKALKQK